MKGSNKAEYLNGNKPQSNMFFTHSTAQSLNNNHFKKISLSSYHACLPFLYDYIFFSSLLLFNKQLTATTTLICSLIYGVYIKIQHNITIIIKMGFCLVGWKNKRKSAYFNFQFHSKELLKTIIINIKNFRLYSIFQ